MDAVVTSYDDFKIVVAELKNQVLSGLSGTPTVRIFYFSGGSPYQIVAVISALGLAAGVGTAGGTTENPVVTPISMIFHETKGTFPASFATDFPSAIQLAEPIHSGVTGWRAS
jgi:hypothetical protein